MIIAATESGLIGDNNGLPWKSRIDLMWFKKNTIGWPVIVGRNTADSIPGFPLKNRQCAIVSGHKARDDDMAPVFASPELACRHFQDFEKIFIAGGAALYNYAMQASSPWGNGPMVDKIIRTVFPDGHADGNKYLPRETMARMSDDYFLMTGFQVLTYIPDHNKYHYEYGTLDDADLTVKDGDTLFPWIRFEIWERKRER